MSFLLTGVGLGFLFAWVERGLFLGLLERGQALRPNFKGKLIPVSGGLIFFFSLLPTLLLLDLFFPGRMEKAQLLAFLFFTALTTLVGLIDDLLGSREASGLKGHFKELLRGRLTTGALKALAVVIAALILFLPYSASVGEALLNTLLVALWVNTLNLFDLRPGRAGKVFILAWPFFSWAAWGKPELAFLWATGGVLLAFLPFDLRARAMMGDAGSNTLGGVLGLLAAWTLGLRAKIILLLVLLLLHFLTERYSLTTIIARNRWLDFLDRLGRRD
ncbi:hypothetical protein Adeg_1388 [Ammonifex degensii KC4]|uniref:Glycosyl transferase family 4 n=1 Tax=Ammonifex degensii (strain DSM 10501 / KC4) TaxID=429009 RepID=C9R861_AMMDK|nr:hypothetical protein [Ammonifex degensii]ACX52490.1 hypothetical protein Adeg_1388 [Ammonifex degensii KC4]